MRITFIKNYKVKDDAGTEYAKGQSIDCSEPSAHHFINRGAAVVASDTKKPEPEKSNGKAEGKAKK